MDSFSYANLNLDVSEGSLVLAKSSLFSQAFVCSVVYIWFMIEGGLANRSTIEGEIEPMNLC